MTLTSFLIRKTLKAFFRSDVLLLAWILLAGTIIRFWDYGSLMFHFDEFSALFRTGYDNFGDLIRKGVAESDTHPAGIQVFLNYWVKITGHREWLIKLPFTLMGIAAVFLAYLIGKQWFNPTVGLAAAMFLSFLQYPVMYSLFARPYASGLFFSLLMVFYWDRAFITAHKIRWKAMLGFVLAGTLCVYNHYFTLFLLALVGLTGLLIVRREYRWFYIGSLAAIILLFLPHLDIFFTQFSKGGVEDWLAKPTPRFFASYAAYILHFSYLMYALVIALLLGSFLFRAKLKPANKYRYLLLGWLTVTYLTAYFYSVYRSAVLQYSVLLFTFPFLIMLIFSFVRDLEFKIKAIIIALFFGFSLFTLIRERKHFEILYQPGYYEVLRESARFEKQKGAERVTTLVALPANIRDYYLEKLLLDNSQIADLNVFQDPVSFDDYLKSLDSDFLTLGWVDPPRQEYLPMAQKYFPWLLENKNWFLCDLYVLSKSPPEKHSDKSDLIRYSEIREYNPPEGVRVDGSQEYFGLFENLPDSLEFQMNNLLAVEVEIRLPGPECQAEVVLEIRSGETLVNWSTAHVSDFYHPNEPVTSVYQVTRYRPPLSGRKNPQLKIYLWNKGHEPLQILAAKFLLYRGNPRLFGLFEEIEE